jgi:hypothetical protein
MVTRPGIKFIPSSHLLMKITGRDAIDQPAPQALSPPIYGKDSVFKLAAKPPVTPRALKQSGQKLFQIL